MLLLYEPSRFIWKNYYISPETPPYTAVYGRHKYDDKVQVLVDPQLKTIIPMIVFFLFISPHGLEAGVCAESARISCRDAAAANGGGLEREIRRFR